METLALIERTSDGKYHVYTNELVSTIIGEGFTVAEAKADFKKSVAELKHFYAEAGEDLPEEIDSAKFVFKYDVASLFEYYSFLNISKFAKLAGINTSLMHQYKAGQYISEKQLKKIEVALHHAGKELSAIKLV